MYHVTEAGPRPCKAKLGKCPYAGRGNNHFESPQEAQQTYEERLTKQYGSMGKVVAKKVQGSARQKFYRKLHKVETTTPAYKHIAQARKVRQHMPTSASLRKSRAYTPQGKSTVGRRMLNKTLQRSKRMVKRQGRKLVRRATSPRTLKKVLGTKYWLPDIHSNKWK